MNESTKQTHKELLDAARSAAQYAYAPRTNKKSGAALLSADGKIYTACNIEFTNYAGSICAEEAALSKAISEGSHKFKALAVVSNAMPCGCCLQFLSEFQDDLEIVAEIDGNIHFTSLKQLLPVYFNKNILD